MFNLFKPSNGFKSFNYLNPQIKLDELIFIKQCDRFKRFKRHKRIHPFERLERFAVLIGLNALILLNDLNHPNLNSYASTKATDAPLDLYEWRGTRSSFCASSRMILLGPPPAGPVMWISPGRKNAA